MKTEDLAYNCWRVLKIILASISLLIALLSSYSWYDTGRIEMLLFLVVGLIGSIYFLTTKL